MCLLDLQVILNGLVTLCDLLMCIRLMKERCHAWIHFRWPKASKLSIQPLSLRSILWRHQNNTKPTKDQYHYFVIKCPSKCFSFTLKLNKRSLCEEIFAEIENLSGIPKTLQILSYRKYLLDTHIPAYKYSFTMDENNIDLSVSRLGGGPTDDGKFNVHICS